MVLVDGVGDQFLDIGPKKFKKPNIFLRLLKNIFLILFFSAVVFVTINLPAYMTIGRFKFNPETFAFEQSNQEYLAKVSKEDGYKPTKQFPDNSIFIPKLGISAPVIYGVGASEVAQQLKNGVVHLGGSGQIGDNKNIFLTGHSSNYWWEEGDYNTVFALLPNLNKNDLIYLTNHGKLKRFVVTDIIEAKKEDVDNYLESASEQLTLMTCIPVGTNLKRLLVIANPD